MAVSRPTTQWNCSSSIRQWVPSEIWMQLQELSWSWGTEYSGCSSEYVELHLTVHSLSSSSRGCYEAKLKMCGVPFQVHTNKKRHSCGQCSKQFHRKTHLLAHMRRHSANPEFKPRASRKKLNPYIQFQKKKEASRQQWDEAEVTVSWISLMESWISAGLWIHPRSFWSLTWKYITAWREHPRTSCHGRRVRRAPPSTSWNGGRRSYEKLSFQRRNLGRWSGWRRRRAGRVLNIPSFHHCKICEHISLSRRRLGTSFW